MNKTNKILLYIGGLLVFVMIGVMIYVTVSKQSQTPSVSEPLPQYILGSTEEVQLKEFARYFLKLYNSYGYGYTSNLSALGDDQTTAMQEKTIAFIEDLNSTLADGFNQITEPDASSFSYTYLEADHITAMLNATVNETYGDEGSPRSPAETKIYSIKAKFKFIKNGDKWFVDNLQITKK